MLHSRSLDLSKIACSVQECLLRSRSLAPCNIPCFFQGHLLCSRSLAKFKIKFCSRSLAPFKITCSVHDHLLHSRSLTLFKITRSVQDYLALSRFLLCRRHLLANSKTSAFYFFVRGKSTVHCTLHAATFISPKWIGPRSRNDQVVQT